VPCACATGHGTAGAYAEASALRFIRPVHFLICLAFLTATAFAVPARAQDDPRAEQQRLAEHIRVQPSDYESTYRYVALSIELRDYEGAIGALERLLMFNPNLSRARKELAFLYTRLGAYQVAAQHMRSALASPDLDPAQKAQIEAQLPDIEKRTQASRLSARVIVGLRAQSNANFFPSGGLFQAGGVGLVPGLGRRSDVNAFQLVQAAHDYEFPNAGGDTLETRASAYATEQFSLPMYNVVVFSGSIGPRLVIPQDTLPGLSVKPYVSAVASVLGSANYLNSGGGGVAARVPLGDAVTFDPGVEWRAIYVNPGNPTLGGPLYSSLSTLATGDVVTGYVGGTYRATDSIRLDWRAAYSRANAALASQRSGQVDVQAMLRLEVDPPVPEIGRRWTIAPYARFTSLAFDAANPFVDLWLARRDTAWTKGVMLDAPINGQFGFTGHLEFARNDSNLANFRTHNVSVSFGPVARF
jgi:tetratricopeptide (TPR) repeat protein